ncbi:MAG: hypothetical protein CM15mV91_360 [uncultured marine virus]|nr:MAG: hypothetical protein CM15mV91_360 [uncultured marine virus]
MKRLQLQAKQGDELADSLLDTDFDRTNVFPITLESFSKPNGKGKRNSHLPAGSVSLNQLLDPLFLQINYNTNLHMHKTLYVKNYCILFS